MTITTRELRRDDVVLTWDTGQGPLHPLGSDYRAHRAVSDQPHRYPNMAWRTVHHTEPVPGQRHRAARTVYFTDGTYSGPVENDAGWIDQRP